MNAPRHLWSRYTPSVAKRGYNRDTIRGGASDWDVSRPFSSYLRLLASLLAHPFRFFEVLPRVPDMRAPGLFLAFSGLPAALVWFVAGGSYEAIIVLLIPLPLSFAVAGLYYAGAFGGRHGYRVTWRTVAYPLGFYLPLSAVPVISWFAAAYAGIVLMTIGLSEVQEIPRLRALLVSSVAVGMLLLAAYLIFRTWF
ncbi:hypothetical protein BH23ACT11_BH23ACT11_21240 [soil metagenome]